MDARGAFQPLDAETLRLFRAGKPVVVDEQKIVQAFEVGEIVAVKNYQFEIEAIGTMPSQLILKPRVVNGRVVRA